MERMAPEPPVARLFIGLWPDEAVRDALAAQAEQWQWPRGARRVPTPKLHLTLHFLGAVPRERVPGLVHGLAEAQFGEFHLHLDRGEVWPNEVAALCPSVVPHALEALHGRLHGVLDALGAAPAREHLRAHVTLARRAHGARPPGQPPRIHWRVKRFALIESMPNSSYRVLRDYG
jgi:2'-5' RNA ligase